MYILIISINFSSKCNTMASNIIGNTFLLAESTVQPELICKSDLSLSRVHSTQLDEKHAAAEHQTHVKHFLFFFLVESIYCIYYCFRQKQQQHIHVKILFGVI